MGDSGLSEATDEFKGLFGCFEETNLDGDWDREGRSHLSHELAEDFGEEVGGAEEGSAHARVNTEMLARLGGDMGYNKKDIPLGIQS